MPKSMLIRRVADEAIQALKVTAAMRQVSMQDLARDLVEAKICPWPGCNHSHEWHETVLRPKASRRKR